jgi:hypothetical protein
VGRVQTAPTDFTKENTLRKQTFKDIGGHKAVVFDGERISEKGNETDYFIFVKNLKDTKKHSAPLHSSTLTSLASMANDSFEDGDACYGDHTPENKHTGFISVYLRRNVELGGTLGCYTFDQKTFNRLVKAIGIKL